MNDNWKGCLVFCLTVLLGMFFCGTSQAKFVNGTVYDQSNWKDIEEYLIPSFQKFIQDGKLIINNTTKPDFEFKIGQKYHEASLKNKGKFDVDKDGILIEISTGKAPGYYFGFPFPEIDAKDPKVAEKIMANNVAIRYRQTAIYDTGSMTWVSGRSGVERKVIFGIDSFFFPQRLSGPIDNPRGYLQLDMLTFYEPFDLRGTITMTQMYLDNSPDSSFAYVPMLRRVRRVAAASNRSDPIVGSDMCIDDQWCWAGKNASMNWTFIGERQILGAITSSKKEFTKLCPDGTLDRLDRKVNFGFEVNGFKGAPWCPVDCVWIPRDVWVVEGKAKDPYYLYGKQTMYVDKNTFTIWMKDVADKSGKYWKTYWQHYDYVETEDGPNSVSLTGGVADSSVMYDVNSDHASLSQSSPYPGRPYKFNLTMDMLNPDYFTETNMRQLSK